MAAIESLLDEKVAVMQRIQEAGFERIENAHNLSISGGDAGDSGFGNNGEFGDGENDATNGPLQNKWLIKGAFQFVPPDFKFPSCKLEQGLVYWYKGMRLENGVIRPFRDFVENKEALPVGKIRGKFSSHWRFSFSEVLEDGLKELGMESKLPPTATPEQLKDCCKNCKVVLRERVSHFCDGGKGLGSAVST